MASYLMVMNEIHVLVVDHDLESLINTARLLQMCQYRVTLVELASVAISMLLSGKTKFDLVMANINSPDLHGLKLLEHAVNMGLPTILMSVDDDTVLTMRAIENGAFLSIKKPMTIEILRCLWQHVTTERMQMMRKRERLATTTFAAPNLQFREGIHQVEENSSNNIRGYKLMRKDKGKSTQKITERKVIDVDEEYKFDNYERFDNKNKRKVWTEWTQEMHDKFMDAVEQLGEGRCFPKEILELMNVPGLTRMQVASHLQKCRNNNWQSPRKRKSNTGTQPVPTNTNGSQHKMRRFGSMPQLGNGSVNHVRVHEATQGSKTSSETHEMPSDGWIDNMETGISTTFHHQHYASLVPNPTNPTFNFMEMDSLIHNFSVLPQESAGVKNVTSSSRGCQLDAVCHEQHSTISSMDNKSQDSSDTSNSGRDDLNDNAK